tara:strand:+ start:96 stop:557 length:462 start_codon:yes stop_codon:yes gene_type:complete
MDIKIFVAIVGLFTVLANILLQFFLGRATEVRQNLIAIRTEAYLHFLDCVGNLERQSELRSARLKVVTLGNTEVVSAIDKYFINYTFLKTKEEQSAFTLIVSEMRKDLLLKTLLRKDSNSLHTDILMSALFAKKESLQSDINQSATEKNAENN